MRTVNLVSALGAYGSLDEMNFAKYLGLFGASPLKKHEMETLKAWAKHIEACAAEANDRPRIAPLDGYYVGYSIPQIGKEFDLLRFSDDCVIDVELKQESSEEKIRKQLIRNRYYLSFLRGDVFCFTYVADEDKLYRLVDDTGKDDIVETDFSTLYALLRKVPVEHANIDALFDPSNYLVSPFNSTEKFMNSEYFLTKQQEGIKEEIMTWLSKKGDNFISLTGSAGTGKTLLAYDIAKEVSCSGGRVLVIHCGNLNQGQICLRNDYDWTISGIKYGAFKDFSDFDLVIVDEVQRIYPSQLRAIIDRIKATDRKCIFSFDGKQCLSREEINWKNVSAIEDVSAKTLKLTDKIRTNKEIADFIRQLLDCKKNFGKHDYPNVEISYFEHYADAKSQLEHLHEKGWKVINYTPGIKNKVYYYETLYNIPETADTPHSVIGQEFDRVVGVIDEYFFYDANGRLEERNNPQKYYSQYGMLYQILTRTRKKVHLVIINNRAVLQRCMEVLGH